MLLKNFNRSVAGSATLYIFICLAISTSVAAAEPATTSSDTIYIQKSALSRSHKFTLTSDADNKVVFFSVKGLPGRVYQLYVFDVEGKLTKQTELRNKQTTLIKNIEKGTYFFEVFTDDMRIGHGQIAVR